MWDNRNVLVIFFFYHLILLKIWLRLQGITQTRKNSLQCEKFFLLGLCQETVYLEPFPGLYQVEKLFPLLKGSTVVVQSWTLPDLPLTLLSNWFWISAGVKFVFQKVNYAARVISRMLWINWCIEGRKSLTKVRIKWSKKYCYFPSAGILNFEVRCDLKWKCLI